MGLNPAKAVGFFGRKNPQYAFFQRESKAVCPCRRFAASKNNPAIYVEVGIAGKIDQPFLAHNSILH
jgi:hypothetical protein